MNIVIVDHYAGSPSLGMEYRPYYFAQQWLKMNHRVIIVGGSYSHVRSKQPDVAGAIKQEIVDGIQYVWIKTNRYQQNGLKRFLSMILFSSRLLTRLDSILRDFKPDLIIASSTYPLEVFPIHRLAKKFKAKFCYEVHDLWPLSPMELGGFSKFHPFIVLMQQAEDYGYKHADCVVSLLPMAKPYMLSRGMKPHKFSYIPNGIVLDEWNSNITLPSEFTAKISSIKQKHKFLTAYAGSHGLANSLDSFLLAGKELSNIHGLVLIGDGPEKKRLQKLVEDEDLQNVYFLDPIKKQFIPAALAEFDALFIGLQRQSLFRFGISPNKMIDYMMAGKPIIQAIEAGNNMVKQYQCGVDVEPENPTAIAEGIEAIMQLSETERLAMGKNGNDAVRKDFDYKVLSRRFLEATETL